LSQIDQFGAISQWTELDRISIVTAKCVGEAHLYIKGVEELNELGLTYARLKECLIERFSEQFHSSIIILRISIKDRIRNEDVRKQLGTKYGVQTAVQLKWKWGGHVSRLHESR
jgi:hypothetical protein